MPFGTTQFGKGTAQGLPKKNAGFGKKDPKAVVSNDLPYSPFNDKNHRDRVMGKPVEGHPGFSMIGKDIVRDACGHLATATYQVTGTCRFKCGE